MFLLENFNFFSETTGSWFLILVWLLNAHNLDFEGLLTLLRTWWGSWLPVSLVITESRVPLKVQIWIFVSLRIIILVLKDRDIPVSPHLFLLDTLVSLDWL